MRIGLAAAVLVLFGALGCGGGLPGTYVATVEEYGQKTNSAPGYTLEEVRKRLAESPRKLHLETAKFQTSEGGRTIWEGSWRKDGDKLILRATRVQGTEVNEKLQQDYTLKILDDGRFADESVYSAYGLRIVFKKE